ncbi:MAG: efflux transporter, family, subunit [Actinomycetia bacterium]|nr:efflux transporter, family, subunit [Actinomycetes bacterium]
MNKKTVINSILGAAAISVAFAGWTALGSSTPSSAAVATGQVTKGIVMASVSATGNVASSKEVGLDFGASGEVTDVLVKAGDTVKAGQVLARIDSTDADVALQVATANLLSAKEKLKDAKAGLTAAERAQLEISDEQAQAQVTSAERSLQNAKDNAALDVVTSKASVDQAKAAIDTAKATATQNTIQYQAALDQVIIQQATDLAQYNADVTSLATATTTLATAQSNYDAYTTAVTNEQADKDYCTANPTSTGPSSGIACSSLASRTSQDQASQSRANSTLSDAKSSYNSLNSSVTSGRAKVVSNQNAVTNATNNKAAGLLKDSQSIANAQTSYANAQNNQASSQLKDKQSLSSADTALASAKLSLRATQAGDLVKLEPAKAAEIATDEAGVLSAQSVVDSAQQALDETALVAPAAATVSSVSGSVGDAVNGTSTSSSSAAGAASATGSTASGSSSSSATSGFIVLTDLKTLQVVAGFSEADAAKVKVGQSAIVTFDALPDQRSSGQIVSVDTTSTVVSNVVTYYVTVLLTQAVDKVKPGMTASAQVVIDEKDGALKVPSSAVTTQGGQSTVTLRSNGQDVRRSVVVGLVGDDSTEIVSGLKEGDTVVTSSGAVSAAGAGARPTGGAGTLTGGGAVPGGGGGGCGGIPGGGGGR